MVFYFSGTGNSEYVATTIANFLGMNKYFIPEIKIDDLESPEDRVVFVFPVYAWGVPPIIEQFIMSLPSNFIERINERGINVDCVMVCGDEVAKAPEMFEKILLKINVKVNSIWSVIMPNNYVLLPGFDIDSKVIEKSKLDLCQGRILEITEGIKRGGKRIDVVRGSMPRIKTGLIYPLFKKYGIYPKKWHYLTSCIGCGKCSAVCPLCNIKMNDGHPLWGSRCCSCLGCYHICPVHAVEYGKITSKKGQYFFPLKKISSRNCHN